MSSPHNAEYQRNRRKNGREGSFNLMVERFPYITAAETVEPQVLTDPPACFTPKEWESYAESVGQDRYYAARTGSHTRAREQPDEVEKRVRRQRAALMFVACDDCTLHYQLGQALVNRCYPPKYAITPADRLLAADRMEEGPDDAATGVRSTTAHVRDEEGVPDREVRQGRRAGRAGEA